MAECTFSFPFDGDPAAFYRQAKAGVKTQGGSFLGDNVQGVITVPSELGDVTFNYRRNDTTKKIVFNVTEKPMLVSCAQIQDAIGALIPKSVKKRVVVDMPGATTATAAKPHVTEMPTQYIEGDPGTSWSLGKKLVWIAAALGFGGLLWLTLRSSRD